MRCSRQLQTVRRLTLSSCDCPFAMFVLFALFGFSTLLYAQTGGTGAISGVITDATGAMVVGAQVKVTDVATGYKRTSQSNDNGLYVVSLLPPGKYAFEVTSPGFKGVSSPDVRVIVAETTTLNISMEPGTVTETVTISSTSVDLETESSSLGRVTDSVLVENLPLVTRNFTQIIGLNPGISQEANNAGSIGKGGGGQGASPGAGSFLSNGATSVDNNFKMNGLPVNDIAQSPGGGSPGAPVPNPDTIQEFKVQTALYDATTGRNAGANVDLITKGGSNQYHATLFEYFRNEALNANDWFANRSGQPRSILRQNQYGFTVGGPLVKDKLLFFGSWQGTKQLNGVDPTSHRLVSLPPLTNDRSAAGLGAVFGGAYGYLGNFPGNVVLHDGSNIAPQALALLQAKLPNGEYVIPTPQTIDSSKPLDIRGTSYLSIPGTFNENQWMVNSDYLRSDRDKMSFRYFGQSSDMTVTLPNSTAGFPLTYPQRYDVVSFGDTYVLNSNMANQFLVGFHRTTSDMLYDSAFKFSDLGITVPQQEDAYPVIVVAGPAFSVGNGASVAFMQYETNITDMLSWVKGKHHFNFGGGFGYGRDVLRKFDYPGIVVPLTWADLLLGRNFTFAPGLAYSNIYQSTNLFGDTGRDWRYKNFDAYVQDNFNVRPGLTLNLGLRFEHLAALGDAGGRMGNMDVSAINPDPSAAGSIEGYVVPSNFRGTIPAGVGRVGTTSGFNNEGQNVWNPRLGFAWVLPGSDRFVLRGGAGVYHTSVIGQMNLQLTTTPPYGIFNSLAGPANGSATLANPFPAAVPLPSFPVYSPSTNYSMWAIAMDFRPPTTYHYSLGLQSKLPGGAILDVSYAGARNLHMVMSTSINQANLASAANPIRGVTTNTIANINSRKPYLGWNTGQMRLFKTGGQAWYNALQVSLSQQRKKLYYQASYTWARLLTPQPSTSLGTNYSLLSGDQNDLRKGYGPDPWIRPQRFILSAVYGLPEPSKSNRLLSATLGGWSISTVTLVQAGHQMGIAYNNANNIYGITSDRPSFAPGCTAANIAVPGSVSSKVDNYINRSCLAAPAVIGSDGIGTDFGNTPIGILRGPGQFNIDLSLGKSFQVPWPNDGASIQFRSDFFNALNHANFADPNLGYTTTPSAFGTIRAMSTNPRVIQFSLKYAF
ncbi:MAG TPA: carboxypeptidase-like regulatory domain-containing protein [Terriglobales bacterium]|nr:carboxypeptidase-like regulatory domain-containing protein [Terriglobales bacterium]